MASILLVEDNPDLAEIIQELLTEAGHSVERTSSGLEALKIAARKKFDMTLLDLEVEDLSGAGTQRALADMRAGPVAMMSAPSDGWKKDALRLGAAACLQKPFSEADLLSVVHAITDPMQKQRVFSYDVSSLSVEDIRRVAAMSAADLDELPFGAIRVDARGIITHFNDLESRSVGFIRETVVGLPFKNVAPCTNVQEFAGALNDAFKTGELDRTLRFVFPVRSATSLVTVRLYYDAVHQQAWVFVNRRPLTTSG